MEIRYCLSPDFSFVDPTRLTNPAFVAGLLDKSSGEVLLLNQELNALLTLFREPASVADAATFFADELKAPFSDVQPVVEASVNTFVEQGILANAESIQKLVAHSFPVVQAGDPISDYTVIKELSITPPVGVYLVKASGGRKRYVLKKLVIHPGASSRVVRAQRNTFAYEFQVLSHLKSCTRVNRLVTFDLDQGIGVIAYFAGMSLRRFIIKNPDLSVDDRTALFSQLLDVMDGVHSRGVLHGDLHSSNVLVNKKKQIKLIDFDMAFFWHDRAKNKVQYGGITDFIPPERLTDDVFHQSAGPPDYRAEVYQIGVLGYLIFHSALPFTGSTWRGQLEAIRHETPVWEAAVPVAMRSGIEQALHKDPARRFATAGAMRAACTREP